MVQWLALQSKKISGLNPSRGQVLFLYGVFMLSPSSQGTGASFHSSSLGGQNRCPETPLRDEKGGDGLTELILASVVWLKLPQVHSSTPILKKCVKALHIACKFKSMTNEENSFCFIK